MVAYRVCNSLEPVLVAVLVEGDEFFVGLRQVNDPFDEADDPSAPAGKDRSNEQDNPWRRFAEIKLMNTESTQEDGEDTCRDAFAFHRVKLRIK